MKKKNLLLSILMVCGVFGLSGCSLFDDSDIAIYNHYNPKDETPEPDPDAVYAGGVEGKYVEGLENILCFKNICYADENNEIKNTYASGQPHHTEYDVNSNQNYESSTSKNNYDLYVPNSVSKTGKHTVILFIHGGAWVMGFKTEANPYVHEFAKRGYITATIKYTLLKRTMDDPSLSIFRNLDEIDACIKSIADVLHDDLGFDTSKTNLVVGGFSSGAHLAMLYSYSRGSEAALPLKMVVDAVGPVEIKPDAWKGYSGTLPNLNKETIAAYSSSLYELGVSGESYNWNEYQTMRIANGMCGIPYSLETVRAATDEQQVHITSPSNPAAVSMTKAGGGEDQLSITYWIEHASTLYPIVTAYAGQDSVVGIAQYAKLQTALDNRGFSNYSSFYLPNSQHQLDPSVDTEQYNAFVNEVDTRCQALEQ